MEKLSEKLINKRFQKEEVKTEEWKETAKEMTKYFGHNCFWIMWKFPKQKIYEAFQACKRENKNNFAYLMGILKK